MIHDDYFRAELAVFTRRKDQDAKWGPSENRPVPSISVLGEEFGEVCEAVNEFDASKEKRDALWDELCDLAAVSVAMLEGMCRGEFPR